MNSALVTAVREMANGFNSTGCDHISLSKMNRVFGALPSQKVPPGTSASPKAFDKVADEEVVSISVMPWGRITQRLPRVRDRFRVHVFVKERELKKVGFVVSVYFFSYSSSCVFKHAVENQLHIARMLRPWTAVAGPNACHARCEPNRTSDPPHPKPVPAGEDGVRPSTPGTRLHARSPSATD